MMALIAKEFRVQSRRKNLYSILFFCLILLSVSTVALSFLYDPSHLNGKSFSSFCFLIALIVYAIVPVFAVNEINLEREGDTFQLLMSSPVSHLELLLGKLFYISTLIFSLLLASLPMGRLLSLFDGITLAKILGSYLVILISAIVVGYISLSVSLLCDKFGTAIAISYLSLAVCGAGTIGLAFLLKISLLNLFSLPNFLVILAIYMPICAVITGLIRWKLI